MPMNVSLTQVIAGYRRERTLVLSGLLAAFVALVVIPLSADTWAHRQNKDGVIPAAQIAWVKWPAADARGTLFNKLEFLAADGHRLHAFTYRASGFDPLNGPIWFVMHGASRNAERYLRAAAPVAERYDALVIAIEFSRRDYPTQSDYTLGVTTHGAADGTALAEGRWRASDTYLYAELERVFEGVRQSLGGRQSGYFVFGHSAGAQFTHRLITFLPNARVLGAVAANAGWYTLPVFGDDPHLAMPYGLRGSAVKPADLQRVFASPLMLLLGSNDLATAEDDSLVRGTPAAMAQGTTRLARGLHYFDTAKASAQAHEVSFKWGMAIAPGAGHEVNEVIASAGFLLFSTAQEPCESSTAAHARGLVFNELLADPAKGSPGDANGDGVRSRSADEFVEIVNAGELPVCLAGWTLSDAKRQRHLFPLGAALDPGKAVIIFGGGVPTGQFGGATVQSATSSDGLSLSNAGDILTLRDADGNIAKQFSWGHCAGKRCAEDHRHGYLSFAGSLVRWPDLSGSWHLHRDVSKFDFSPGVRADGTSW